MKLSFLQCIFSQKQSINQQKQLQNKCASLPKISLTLEKLAPKAVHALFSQRPSFVSRNVLEANF